MKYRNGVGKLAEIYYFLKYTVANDCWKYTLVTKLS